jgi:hypothetical protein
LYWRALEVHKGTLALKVKDDLMRDAAIREIVELCLNANDLKTAQILLRAVQSEAIREDVLNAIRCCAVEGPSSFPDWPLRRELSVP